MVERPARQVKPYFVRPDIALEYPLSQARETRMNEAEFQRAATATLNRIEQAVEACGADIEFENAGEILELEFANRSKIIINKQAAAKQIWVAAKSGGFHYSYDAGTQQWRNDQSGAELFDELSRLLSEQAGARIALV
jgi:CyaY protein